MRTCMPFSPRHPAGAHLQGVQEPVALQHGHCGGSACCDHIGIAAGGKVPSPSAQRERPRPTLHTAQVAVSPSSAHVSAPCSAGAAQFWASVMV